MIGVLDLVQMHRLAVCDPRLEVLALEHLLQRHARIQLHHIVKRHQLEPLTVEHHLRPRRVENLERLLLERRRVRHHIIVRELTPRLRSPGWIANHRREIADDQNRLMPEILKLPQLRQPHREPEMDVRRRRVHAQLHIQRTPEPQLRQQFLLGNNLRGAAL